MDGRFGVYRAIPETQALDQANDVLALSQEGRTHLAHAYQAHIASDWASYLYCTDRLDRSLRDIRDTAPAGDRMKYPTRAELVSPGVERKRRPAVERLLTRFAIEPNGCWRWTRAITTSGYGHFSIRSVYFQAHLLMYILLVGPLPDGLEPDHTCRNRWCVNPAHVEFVTHAVNCQRGIRARLTPSLVTAIRASRSQGVGVRALARQYGVNPATVSRIVNGLIWREGHGDIEVQAAA